MAEFNFLLGLDINLFLSKVFFLVVTFMFTLFLVVVLKQTLSMQKIISDSNDSLVLRLIAFGLLMGSLSLFLTSLVIL